MTINMGIEFKKNHPFKLLTQSQYEKDLKEKFGVMPVEKDNK
jgi:hypothetical protein